MVESEHFLFSIEDGVGVITFNRPERLNPINWDMGSLLARTAPGDQCRGAGIDGDSPTLRSQYESSR